MVLAETPSAAAAPGIDIPTAWYVPAVVPGAGSGSLVTVVGGVIGRGSTTRWGEVRRAARPVVARSRQGFVTGGQSKCSRPEGRILETQSGTPPALSAG